MKRKRSQLKLKCQEIRDFPVFGTLGKTYFRSLVPFSLSSCNPRLFYTFRVSAPHKDLYSTVKFSETVVQGLEGLRRKFEDLSNECEIFQRATIPTRLHHKGGSPGFSCQPAWCWRKKMNGVRCLLGNLFVSV